MTPAVAHSPDAVGETAQQLAYSQQRAAWRGQFLDLAAAGAFEAPEHLRPALQGDLGLGHPAPLILDASRSEAA